MKNEKTSKMTAEIAARVLADPKSTKAARTLAGSALTQRPDAIMGDFTDALPVEDKPRFVVAVNAGQGDDMPAGTVSREDVRAVRQVWIDHGEKYGTTGSQERVLAWLDTLLGGNVTA